MTLASWSIIRGLSGSENEPWLQLAVVLALGTLVITAAAALVDRFVRSAIWQRTIWQVATLGVVALLGAELTGTGPALVGLWRAQTQPAAGRLPSNPSQRVRTDRIHAVFSAGRPARPDQSGFYERIEPTSPRLAREEGAFREGRQEPLPAWDPAGSNWVATAAAEPLWLNDADAAVGGMGNWAFFMGSDRSLTLRGRVARVERSEPPDPRLSGGSPGLDPGHPTSDHPDLGVLGAPYLRPSAYAHYVRPSAYAHPSEAVGAPPEVIADGDGAVSISRGVREAEIAARLPTGTGGQAVVETSADPQPPADALRWLGVIWALGVGGIGARSVYARVLLFSFWRRHRQVGDAALCERVHRLARCLGLRRRVWVLEAVGLRAPVAFGSFWPAVALPVTFAEDFDRRQQDAVLAHELAHLAARDPAWHAVAGLLCAALWWHPLVWWLRHRLWAASEAAADEASLLVPEGPDLLAGCLVAIGRRLAYGRRLGWLSFEGPGFRSSLGRRVERLLNLRARSWRAPGRGRMAFAKALVPVALVIVALCCTAWARPQATRTEEGGTTMSVLRSSWRHSLAAAMLALFSAGCSDAVADDPPADQSLPAVAGSDLAGAQVQLALLAEGQEREKGEAREREEGDRDKPEAREREGGERDKPEAREREEGDRDKPEARERKEGDRDKPEARERQEGDRDKPEAREREGGERREVEMGRPQLLREVQILEAKARDIRRRLEGLRDGQDAEARELQGALREVEQRMEAIRRELRGPEGVRELFERADAERQGQVLRLLTERHKALSEQAAAIQRALEGLRRDDQAEQARKHREKLADVRAAIERVQGEIRERSQRLGRPPEGADRPRPDQPRPDREQLVRRLEELKALVGRLAEAGKREEAEAREREVREIVRLLEGGPERPAPGPPAEELQRRIGHLKVAIDNLRAAGLNEQAQQLLQQVDRLIEEHRRLTGRAPEPPRPPEPRERPVPPELAERLEQQGQAIRELNGALNELREQMAQLRQMVQQLRQPERPERR